MTKIFLGCIFYFINITYLCIKTKKKKLENNNFDDIRPYRDDEANNVFTNLLKDDAFIDLLRKIFSEEKISVIKEDSVKVKSIKEFQTNYIIPYLRGVIDNTIEKLSFDGIENIPKNTACLFISNHRDIILDPALLNEILFRNNISTTEIGIGNNLLISPWIKQLVRLNKSFIVRRDVKGKKMLIASKQLSEYIRNAVAENNRSIWIAQRQGRTKDGNDKTQAGLLKMFNFSGKSDFITNFKELNIIPVSISYEYEPCDDSKAAEMYVVREGKVFKKKTGDDLRSMGRGMACQKGFVHFSFGKITNDEFKTIGAVRNKNKKIELLAKLIDKKIYAGYKLKEFNYIAYDILNKKQKFKTKYSPEKKQKFINYIQKNIYKITGDNNIIKEILLEIYATPVKNKLNL